MAIPRPPSTAAIPSIPLTSSSSRSHCYVSGSWLLVEMMSTYEAASMAMCSCSRRVAWRGLSHGRVAVLDSRVG